MGQLNFNSGSSGDNNSGAPPLQDADNIAIKLSFGDEHRRLSIAKGTAIEELISQIAELLGVGEDEVVLKYTDADADLVTMTTTPELETAIAHVNGQLLRLTVVLQDPTDPAGEHQELNEFGYPVHALRAAIPNVVCRFTDYGAQPNDMSFNNINILRGLFNNQLVNGGTLVIPKGTYFIHSTDPFGVGVNGNTIIQGEEGAANTVLLFSSVGSCQGLITTSSNVTFTGLTIKRGSDTPIELLFIGSDSKPMNNITISNCVIDGQRNIYGSDSSGINLMKNTTSTDGFMIQNTVFQNLTNGLTQPNETKGKSLNFVVDGCTFQGNYSDDLCFNSPLNSARMTKMTVRNSHFMNNNSNDISGGYAVSFAYCYKCVVTNCDFTNYPFEAIHIEDLSKKIDIGPGNKFVKCSTKNYKNQHGFVQIVSGSQNITVKGNDFDGTQNPGPTIMFLVDQAGTDKTFGGHTPTPPKKIKIIDNTVKMGKCRNAFGDGVQYTLRNKSGGGGGGGNGGGGGGGKKVKTPKVPHSQASKKNNSGVDVMVTVSGATCKNILLDGNKTGKKGGPQRVANGHKIGLIYTGAKPTWVWKAV